MDAALLQQKIYGGYGKAALRVGQSYAVYRPDLTGSAANPIVDSNLVATLLASFNSLDMNYQKPNGYGKATWYCLADGTQLEVGDYMVGPGGTFFIAAMQETLPILAVQCNRQARIGRMPPESGAGLKSYSGIVQSEEIDALGSAGPEGSFSSGWPASILFGGRSDGGTTLPSGVKMSGVVVLLPPSVPIEIVESDVIQDNLGRDYAIYTAELSDLGWRIQANEEHS